jgi:predicted transcriptional regulator
VHNNSVALSAIAQLIEDVYAALRRLREPAAPVEVSNKPQPAVPVRKSVTPDFIVCLEDGMKFKSLKRHLSARYNLRLTNIA